MNRNLKDKTDPALVGAFLPYIRKRAALTKGIGLVYDDIVQEGLIGLLGAVDSFEDDRGAAFETYAIACIDNRIRSALRQDARMKHRPLNNYLSLSDGEGCGAEIAVSVLPEDMVILREEADDLVKRIHRLLSSFERDVLVLHLEGYSYSAISELLSSTPKSVDNALQRARRKLKK